MPGPLLFDAPLSAGIRNQVAAARLLREAGAEVFFLSAFPLEKVAFRAGPGFPLDDFTTLLTEEQPPLDDPVLPAGADPDGSAAIARQLEGRSRIVFETLRRHYEATLRRIATVLSERQPAAVVVADDGIACDNLLTTMARERGIPVLCLPYGDGTYEDLEKAVALKRANDRGYGPESPGAGLVARLYPKWLKTGENAGSLLLRPEVILAKETLGVTCRCCWRIYGSEADLLCVAGERDRDTLLADGVEPGRIAVTGSTSGTVIQRALAADHEAAAAFRRPVKLRPGRTRLLVNLPPSYHDSRRRYLERDESFAETVERLVRPMRWLPGVEVTVSAHPATTESDREALRGLGLELDPRYLLELIPRHDVMVTDFSSTIRWAVACGKPVLNYDFYGFALTVYDEAPGVLTRRDYADYRGTLEALCGDETCFAEAARHQIEAAPHQGRIDEDFAAAILGRL